MKESRLRRPPATRATSCSKDAIEAARVETHSTASSGLPARRALVVGADSATLQLCRDALESSGFAAHAVDSGIAAVVAARESPPDQCSFATFLAARRSDGSDLTWRCNQRQSLSSPQTLKTTWCRPLPSHMPRCRNRYRPQRSGAQFAKFSIETTNQRLDPRNDP